MDNPYYEIEREALKRGVTVDKVLSEKTIRTAQVVSTKEVVKSGLSVLHKHLKNP